MYPVSQELLEECQRAVTWYETRGMKVAKTPPIPHAVASWILRHCIPLEDATEF